MKRTVPTATAQQMRKTSRWTQSRGATPAAMAKLPLQDFDTWPPMLASAATMFSSTSARGYASARRLLHTCPRKTSRPRRAISPARPAPPPPERPCQRTACAPAGRPLRGAGPPRVGRPPRRRRRARPQPPPPRRPGPCRSPHPPADLLPPPPSPSLKCVRAHMLAGADLALGRFETARFRGPYSLAAPPAPALHTPPSP